MSQTARLRSEAERLAGPLPPLLAAAEHLASTVILGEHGRRRSGQGDEFWQYRPMLPGDEARAIDWRRSARSDTHFAREKEWQAAQSIVFWVDGAQSMQFASNKELPTKAHRAHVLAMALSVLLIRAGERVGLADAATPPRSGDLQLLRMAARLAGDTGAADYGVPEMRGMMPHSRAVFVSDFLGPTQDLTRVLTRAADRGIEGALVQVLDPQEEAFPFTGRTIFDSIGGSISHETQKAADLKDRYLERLAARKAELEALAQATGWQFTCHHTNTSASSALLWLYQALERVH